MYRTLLANSRLPVAAAGDLKAQIGACRIGVEALARTVRAYGLGRFEAAVSRMYDHGEAIVRGFLDSIPDGRYVARCAADNDGITDDPVEFEVAVEVHGSDVVVDFTNAPPETAGPINTPLPSTVSMARLAIMTIAGSTEAANEGHFRPIQVRARLGTLFYPRPPAPIFLYGWVLDQALEAIYRAMSESLPDRVPASSGGDICGLIFWGRRAGGEFWTGGMDHSVGQGATSAGDGGAPLMIISLSGVRNTPAEVLEARYPLLVERCELAPDSAGAGRHAGGLGVDAFYRILEDSFMTSALERTKTPPWGLFGGGTGRANVVEAVTPEGQVQSYGKVTRLPLPSGSLVRLKSGGGGGYGPASERDPTAVRNDVADGRISEAQARLLYPHAFGEPPPESA
jgi:N-methylhydantoinase B